MKTELSLGKLCFLKVRLMMKFLTRLRNFLAWKIEEFSKHAVKFLAKILIKITKSETGTFKEKQLGIFAFCMI